MSAHFLSSLLSLTSMLIIVCLAALLGVNLTQAQVTLPSMVTIPQNAPLAPAGSSNFSLYVMTIYDQACVNQTQLTSVNSTDPNDPDDGTLSQWVQSQYVVYIGAVALNNNNTCQVVCQVQTLKQFAIMFGSNPGDIRTRSVLVGRVYMTTMEDDTSCSVSGADGVCMAGECVADNSSNTTTMLPETTTSSDENITTTILPNDTTTVAGAATTTGAPASG